MKVQDAHDKLYQGMSVPQLIENGTARLKWVTRAAAAGRWREARAAASEMLCFFNALRNTQAGVPLDPVGADEIKNETIDSPTRAIAAAATYGNWPRAAEHATDLMHALTATCNRHGVKCQEPDQGPPLNWATDTAADLRISDQPVP